MKNRIRVIALRLRRGWKTMLVIALVATVISVVLWETDPLGFESSSELSAYDNGLNFFTNKAWFPWGQHGKSEDIILVALDDTTLSGIRDNEQYRLNFGRFPYARYLWREVLTYLVEEGAKQVVMDVTFDEPGSSEGEDVALVQTVRDRKVPLYFGFNVVANAKPLPKVMAKNVLPEAPVRASVQASSQNVPAKDEETFPSDDEFPSEEAPKRDAAKEFQVAAQAMAFPVQVEGALAPRAFEEGTNPMPPLPGLTSAVPGLGVVAQEADDDGKLRRTFFAYRDEANRYVTLPMAAAADYFGANQVVLAPGKLSLGSHEVPINQDGSAEINYGGPLFDRFRAVSLLSVLNDAAYKHEGKPRAQSLRGLFKDKIVIIGATALGTADSKVTPFGHDQPGVVKQAATMDNLLHDRFILLAPLWVSILLALFVAFISVMLGTAVSSTVVDIGWPLLLFFGFFAVTGIFLVGMNLHVNSTMPMVAGNLASIATTAFNRFFGDEDRKWMREFFGRYMEKEVLDLLVEQHRPPDMTGEMKEVTAFFSDIRGFSTFSEKLKAEPKRLMNLLNRYFDAVTPELKAHGGMVDKFIGDAVVCLFGAPFTRPTHARDACMAALAVQESLEKLREALKQEGLPDVYTRIGLNTDDILVGNIGSSDTIDYTGLGDGMNLAARLEGVNKVYETLILIGPRTFDQAKDSIEAREVDRVRVAGKHEAVTIYELLGKKGELSPTKRNVCELYGQALAAYREQRFADAMKPLAEALKLDENDGPSKTLEQRCRKFLEHPPASFDGVTTLEK